MNLGNFAANREKVLLCVCRFDQEGNMDDFSRYSKTGTATMAARKKVRQFRATSMSLSLPVPLSLLKRIWNLLYNKKEQPSTKMPVNTSNSPRELK
ncbi:MAG TPA: hypothetical protein VFE53_01325 [Mucilaginibacter sp.]|nr:hypothetical protein [Mucilaginibacter sp.]